MQHISVILHRSRCIFFDVISRLRSVFILISLPADKVFLTILSHLVIYDSVDGVNWGFFVLWYVSLLLRVIVVVFEHVWGESKMAITVSWNIEPEVAMCHAGDNWRPPGPIWGHRGGCHDAERQQLVGAICLRSLEGPRASNATDQSVLGRNRWPGLWTGRCS